MNALYRRGFCSKSWLSHLFETDSSIPRYWERELALVNRSSAKSLINKLVVDNILGYSGANEKHTASLGSHDLAKARVVDLACSWKRARPETVLLVRIGDFYETWGVDAVMLVQHAGLNPMGDSCRAGCPKGNIQQTLNALTEAGLTVAVYEEVNAVGSKSTRSKKERYLSQVVTPGRSIYLHDTCLREGEIVYRDSKPYAAIRCTQDGCGLGFISIDSKEVRLHEGLTEEALASLIDSVGGVAEPVWIAADTSTRIARIKRILSEYRTKKLSVSLPMDSMLTAVSGEVYRQLCLPYCGMKVIRESSRSLGEKLLRPLHTGAAQLLGLSSSTSTTPDLVRHILPESAPFYSISFMKNWLLCPPPVEVIQNMRVFVQSLLEEGSKLEAIPHIRPVSVSKLVRLLESKNGNHHFFKDLHQLCYAFVTTEGSPGTECLLSSEVHRVVSYSSGISEFSNFSEISLNANKIIEIICSQIHLVENQSQNEDELSRFFRFHESKFVNIIKGDFSRLEAAKQRLIFAVETSLISPEKSLKFDQMSDKLFVKDVSLALRPGIKQLAIPDDSKKRRFSSDLILRAELEYREASEAAKQVAKETLEDLSSKLSQQTNSIQTLIYISHFAVVISSVALHVEASIRKRWTLPSLDAAECTLNQVWPYWLEINPVGSAVANNFSISSGRVSILTAPNMSGKSTLIRSVAASVLLGNVGLMVPCESACIPRISDLLIVSPAGDRPAEGLSAFAAEADSMGVALRHSDNKHAMLLVDEFGRGTSGSDAAALSAAVISWLSQKTNVSCVWATHLHELFDLCQTLPVEWIQMDGYKLVNGKCIDSKGIATAHQHGFPLEIIKHAFLLRNQNTFLPLIDEEKDVCPVGKIKRSHKLVELKPFSLPPPSVLASPVVYILKFPNDTYYVGETENFLQRIKAHKARFKQAPEKIWFSQQSGRSQARALETALIQSFLKDGVQLLSTVDGFHKSSSSALQQATS